MATLLSLREFTIFGFIGDIKLLESIKHGKTFRVKTNVVADSTTGIEEVVKSPLDFL